MITWRKSSRSSSAGDDRCVELAQLPNSIGVRDSKSPENGNLSLEPARFTALVQTLKSGKYDR